MKSTWKMDDAYPFGILLAGASPPRTCPVVDDICTANPQMPMKIDVFILDGDRKERRETGQPQRFTETQKCGFIERQIRDYCVACGFSQFLVSGSKRKWSDRTFKDLFWFSGIFHILLEGCLLKDLT